MDGSSGGALWPQSPHNGLLGGRHTSRNALQCVLGLQQREAPHHPRLLVALGKDELSSVICWGSGSDVGCWDPTSCSAVLTGALFSPPSTEGTFIFPTTLPENPSIARNLCPPLARTVTPAKHTARRADSVLPTNTATHVCTHPLTHCVTPGQGW